MIIKLTELEHEALDDCLRDYLGDDGGLDANASTIISRGREELELDLSTVGKRRFTTYVVASLETMTDPDIDSGWSSPERRRDACIRLAAKLDDALHAAEKGVLVQRGMGDLGNSMHLSLSEH
jgi:hypothetical protein